MASRRSNPIHTAGPRPQPKPRIYNRPWHLDADGRRHRGRRLWDPAAVEEIIRLAGEIDWLYPPDFSSRDCIRFRASGSSTVFAELRTGRADCLRLILRPRRRTGIRAIRAKLQIEATRISKELELRIISVEQVFSPAFKSFFSEYAAQFR